MKRFVSCKNPIPHFTTQDGRCVKLCFVCSTPISPVLVERGVIETPSPARVSPSARRIFRLSTAPCGRLSGPVSPIANSLYMFSRADPSQAYGRSHIQRNTISARATPPSRIRNMYQFGLRAGRPALSPATREQHPGGQVLRGGECQEKRPGEPHRPGR